MTQGYTNAKGDSVAGLSPDRDGFQFCRLSAEPLFIPQGEIRDDVRYAQLAEFVWFTETGSGRMSRGGGSAESPLLGVHEAGPFTCSTTAS